MEKDEHDAAVPEGGRLSRRLLLGAGAVAAFTSLTHGNAAELSPGAPTEHSVPRAYREKVQQQLQDKPHLTEQKHVSIHHLDRQGSKEIKEGTVFPKLVRGNPRRRTVALTFDDGPHPGFTERLLAVLKAASVRATFFVIGFKVDAAPELVRMEADAGHEVANHTYHHLRLPKIPPEQIEPEMHYGGEAIKRALRGTPHASLGSGSVCRPPGGEYDQAVIDVAIEYGYTLALWTDDPGDYTNPGADKILQRAMRDLSAGGIILLHSGVEETLQVLPEILERTKRLGYEFVTCSEMLREPGCIRTGGPNTFEEPPKSKG